MTFTLRRQKRIYEPKNWRFLDKWCPEYGYTRPDRKLKPKEKLNVLIFVYNVLGLCHPLLIDISFSISVRAFPSLSAGAFFWSIKITFWTKNSKLGNLSSRSFSSGTNRDRYKIVSNVFVDLKSYVFCGRWWFRLRDKDMNVVDNWN